MAKKMTLAHESGFLKKEHKTESVAQVKASYGSSKRSTSRKERNSPRPPSDHGSVRHSGSGEQLDSGLGSIDSQAMEAPQSSSDHHYGATSGCYPPTHSLRQHYHPPRSAPCSCCSHGHPSQRTTPPFWHHGPHPSIRPVGGHTSDMTHHYHSEGAYPFTMAAYSEPANFQHSRVHSHQQHLYWSDPCGRLPPAVHSLPGERSPWEPPPGTQSSPSSKEREVVRKKLLAIFSAPLVDAAMDMFPQLMDPQRLAAEILMLQSQSRMR